MKKIVLLLICSIIPFNIYALEYPKINSKIVEIYDLNDNKVLYEVDSNEVVSIASLTKIATIITALENIKDLDEQVTITYQILKTVDPVAAVAGLKVGDKVTYRDLLYASMLPSGADATNAFAILSSGSVDNFIAKMNELAKRIGLNNTQFKNVTGLDEEGHYSSANDVRKLLEYSLKNKVFREIYSTKKYQLTNSLNVKSTLYKYNAKGSAIDKIIGSKSGYTKDAGYCLSSLSNINGHEMIIITLKAEEKSGKYLHVEDAATLIDFMNNNYKNEVLIEKNKLVKTIPVDLSKTENYKIYSDKKIEKYLPSDYDKNDFKIKYDGLKELNFKNHKNDKIGTISYYFKDELLYKQKVILNKKIDLDFIKLIKKYKILIISLTLFLILLLTTFVFTSSKHHNKKKRKR